MIADLKPYSAYKGSGVPWLEAVPEHWEVRRLGQIGRLSKGNGGNKEDEVSLGVPCVRYGDLYTTHTYFILKSRSFVSMAKAEDYTPITFGDVLFAASGETIDEIGKSAVNLMQSEACCGGDVILFRPERQVEARYMGYATDCRPAATQKATMGRGITVKHIYGYQLKYLTLPLPPLPEQAAIVRFLDHADRRIRRYIRAKQKLIKLLEEQKQAIIHQAVTGQIDVRAGQPYPAYKTSGVDWLGEVPEHWEMRRCGGVFSEVVDTGYTDAELLSIDRFVGVVRQTETGRKERASEDRLTYKRVRPGQLAYNLMNAFMGSIGVSALDGILSPAYAVAEPLGQIDTCFFHHLLRTPLYTGQFYRYSYGIMYERNRLYFDRFKQIPLLVPPYVEQKAIVVALTAASAEFSRRVECLDRQIQLVTEYRTRLIADVVTGKLAVREAAARLPEVDPLAEEFDAPIQAAETGVMELEDANESPEELAMENEVII